ncbi:unnamed protein product [Protopolystoma xenopodis]|uniref:Uncharacterized protein n=1 Tax=Protopolystoma xenopodis TaxID=117903 RepID=A0A448XDF3_9PLAT|nr:unnamed protein product [Protopolystoma xenopodis]
MYREWFGILFHSLTAAPKGSSPVRPDSRCSVRRFSTSPSCQEVLLPWQPLEEIAGRPPPAGNPVVARATGDPVEAGRRVKVATVAGSSLAILQPVPVEFSLRGGVSSTRPYRRVGDRIRHGLKMILYESGPASLCQSACRLLTEPQATSSWSQAWPIPFALFIANPASPGLYYSTGGYLICVCLHFSLSTCPYIVSGSCILASLRSCTVEPACEIGAGPSTVFGPTGNGTSETVPSASTDILWGGDGGGERRMKWMNQKPMALALSQTKHNTTQHNTTQHNANGAIKTDHGPATRPASVTRRSLGSSETTTSCHQLRLSPAFTPALTLNSRRASFRLLPRAPLLTSSLPLTCTHTHTQTHTHTHAHNKANLATVVRPRLLNISTSQGEMSVVWAERERERERERGRRRGERMKESKRESNMLIGPTTSSISVEKFAHPSNNQTLFGSTNRKKAVFVVTSEACVVSRRNQRFLSVRNSLVPKHLHSSALAASSRRGTSTLETLLCPRRGRRNGQRKRVL